MHLYLFILVYFDVLVLMHLVFLGLVHLCLLMLVCFHILVVATGTFLSDNASTSLFAGASVFLFINANASLSIAEFLFTDTDALLSANIRAFRSVEVDTSLSTCASASLSIRTTSVPLFPSFSFHVLRPTSVVLNLRFFLAYFLPFSSIIAMTIQTKSKLKKWLKTSDFDHSSLSACLLATLSMNKK